MSLLARSDLPVSQLMANLGKGLTFGHSLRMRTMSQALLPLTPQEEAAHRGLTRLCFAEVGSQEGPGKSLERHVCPRSLSLSLVLRKLEDASEHAHREAASIEERGRALQRIRNNQEIIPPLLMEQMTRLPTTTSLKSNSCSHPSSRLLARRTGR